MSRLVEAHILTHIICKKYTERIKKRKVNSFGDLHLSVMRDSKNIHMGRKNNHSLINS